MYSWDRPIEIFGQEVDPNRIFKKDEFHDCDFEDGAVESNQLTLTDMFQKGYPIERIFKEFVTNIDFNK